MPPVFSIIIPAHNEENYLRKTLHSLKSQTYQDFETIIVTNGCTDKTEEIAKKRANKKLRVFSLPRPNVSVARNAGALNAEGEILVFLDADTTLEQDALKKIKEEFCGECSVATTKSKADIEKLKFKTAIALKNFHNISKIYEGCSGVLICRKQDFQKANGYDPELIVKEHRKLILKLKQFGKYKCINAYATTSMRRFQQWGLGKAASFWAKQWIKDLSGKLKESEYEKIR